MVLEYTGLSQQNLQDAETLLAQGNYHQASEKFWGAAAVMVKVIAERRGWPHGGHRELNRAISRLSQETGRRELIRLFGSANALHTNFYEDWLTPEQVTELSASVRELLDELRQLLEA
jgi:hypothetical protein